MKINNLIIKEMKKVLLIIGVIAAVILSCIFVTFIAENGAINYEESIENTAGDIRVEEKRRFDLIPNLVDCVKQYDLHEYNTLTELVKQRSSEDLSSTDQIKTFVEAVAEAYPDLKSQKNYQELMNELSITENRISDLRKFYNQNVTNYKRYIRVFPNKQLLSLRGYQEKPYERMEFTNTSVDAPTNIFGNTVEQ